MPEAFIPAMVYDFEVLDGATHRWVVADRKGTLDAIARVAGVPMRATVLVVDSTRLDEEGFLVKTRIPA